MKKNLLKILTILLTISLSMSCMVTFAYAAGPNGVSIENATVELDGTNDGTVSVVLKADSNISFFAIQGTWAPNPSVPSDYFTLTAISSDKFTFSGMNYASTATGAVVWADDSFVGASFNAGESVLIATYTVDANTPAGTYEITFTTKEGMTADWSSFGAETYNATITVTHKSSHTCTPTVVKGQAATCTVDGWKDYYQCSDNTCGKLYADAEGTTEIPDLAAWKIGDGKVAAGHTYGELIEATDAVHTQTELKGAVAAHYFCDVCDSYFTEAKLKTTLDDLTGTVPVHTSTEGDDNNCTTAVTCACGYVITAAKTHVDGDDKNHVCDNAGCNVDNITEHGFSLGFRYTSDGADTNTHTKYCNDCNQEIESKIACSDAIGDNNHSCDANCGNTSVTDHTPEADDGDCTTAILCTECGAETTAAKATHIAGTDDGDCTTAVKCVNCDKNAIAAKTHVDGNDKNHVCDNAGCTVDNVTKHGFLLGFRYDNITDTTHDTYCLDCEKTIETDVAHDYAYNAAVHKCICGKVETFTLSVEDMPVQAGIGVSKTFDVPYGTKILEYIAGKVNTDRVAVDSDTHKGFVIWDGNWGDYEGYTYLNEDSTMTGDMRIYAVTNSIGWRRANTEDAWGYVDENCVYVTGWYEIEGDWYYFFKYETGYNYRAEGLTRVPYPTEAINGVTYAPNPEDVEYANNKGIAFKDATEAWFGFNADGKFQSDFTGLTAHPVIEGAKCYAEKGMIAWHPGFVTVENELYYFVGDAENGGNKMAEGVVYVTRGTGENTYEPGYIDFVAGQVNTMVDRSILAVTNSAGQTNHYYFESGVCQPGKGLVKYGDLGYIYVRSAGQIVVNADYYVPANDLGVVSGKYSFNNYGIMQNPNINMYNGVVDSYYYVDGKIAYGAGLTEWEGNIYYVRSNGKVATGKYYVTNTNGMEGFAAGMKLIFGEDGKMEAVKDGIVDGYYYENNHVMYGAGLIEWQGNIYYVRSNGQVATGKYYVTNTNGMEGFVSGQKCCFDEDGKLITE